MKKEYVRPSMVCETFAADEYVAACGDSGKVYKFVCDAPAGRIWYYQESDGEIDGVYKGTGNAIRRASHFSPCGATHEAPVADVFYDGFVDRNRNGKCDEGENAIIWLEKTGFWSTNGHATANLNMDIWEEVKS